MEYVALVKPYVVYKKLINAWKTDLWQNNTKVFYHKITFQMDYCLFKAKHMARMVTGTAFSCFFILK